MGKILALDTTTQACSVALGVDGAIDEEFIVAPQDHTQRLLPLVDQMLSRHGLSLAELDAIAFGAGPGSFTGLRICLGVVQGLAFGANVAVIPVSSLAITAASARRLLGLAADAWVLPAFDARMDEVYWALYGDGDENTGAVIADTVSSPAELGRRLASRTPDRPVVGVGDGWRCAGMPVAALARTEVDIFPHAYDAVRLAEPCWRRGETQSPLEITPTYIRDEVRWTKRQKIRS